MFGFRHWQITTNDQAAPKIVVHDKGGKSDTKIIILLLFSKVLSKSLIHSVRVSVLAIVMSLTSPPPSMPHKRELNFGRKIKNGSLFLTLQAE